MKRQSDKAGEVPKTMVMPVGMPQDTEFGAYFRHQRAGTRALFCIARSAPCSPLSESTQPMFSSREAWIERSRLNVKIASPKKPGLFQRLFLKRPKRPESIDDIMLQLASCIKSDGGMPGQDEEERWVSTATVLLCFLAEGQTVKSGVFRVHLQKLIGFLKVATSTVTDERKQQLVALVEKETHLPGNWQERARALAAGDRSANRGFWQEVSNADKSKN